MRLRRAILGFFVAGALALAFLPAGPSGGRELLAQTANCGAYSGNVCKETKSCIWWLFGRICTTNYYYYKTAKDNDSAKELLPK